MFVRGAALFFLISNIAVAQDDKDACVTAADRGQQLRDELKLIEAREQFIACAREPCSSVIAKQCAQWLKDVEPQIPTIAFRARDPNGKDITEVQVLLDGVVVASALDGKPIAVNPGVHRFVYRSALSPDLSDTLVIRTGEKNRLHDIAIGSAGPKKEEPAPLPAQGFRVPWTAVAFGALSVGGFATMTVLAISASEDASNLRHTCAPNCNPSAVDDVRARIAGANVAAGVGIGALAVGALFLILANVGPSQPRARAQVTADGFRLTF